MPEPIKLFDTSAIERDGQGIARYVDRPPSLVAMLRRTVDRVPDGEALAEVGGERITYRQLWDRAARVAGGLRDQGIRPGDRVAIRLGNGVDWCVAFFGSQLAGAVTVPVNIRFAEPEVDYVLEDSGASFSFRPGEPLPDADPHAVEDLAPDDLAAIFYTSGTTGFPKGAMTSHANFLANSETGRRVRGMERDEYSRNLVSVPLFHVTGCNSQLLPTTENGGTTVIMPTFEVQSFLRTIVEERVNVLTSVPAIYWFAVNQENFAEFDVSAVEYVMYGGAPMAPDLIARLREEFPNARLGNGYGLTETSSISTFLPHEYVSERPETVGFAAPVVDLRLEKLHETDDVGELLIRGPNVVQGYWNKPEQTAETFVDDWLHTGDLARLDDEGFVQIVDRAKDMVNRGGENVYCVEVENALSGHPDVFEVAVLGVPDQMMGEKVGAVLVPKPGAQLDVADVLAYARTRLADFKLPQYVDVRKEELPRNPGGKILKPTLREHASWERI